MMKIREDGNWSRQSSVEGQESWKLQAELDAVRMVARAAESRTLSC